MHIDTWALLQATSTIQSTNNKFFIDSNPIHSNLLQTSTQRMKQELLANGIKNGVKEYRNNPIEEVKDEWNDSKLSFNTKDETLDVDIEAVILVEDKICSLNSTVVEEYWEVTLSVYAKIEAQFDIIAGELKHIKTIKLSLLLEYIVLIVVSQFGNDPKMHKATELQFQHLKDYIHQNILLLIDIIIDKSSIKETNKEWMDNLKSIIDSKLTQMWVKTTGLNHKPQSKLETIKQNWESIVPILKNLLSKRSSQPIKKGKKSLPQVILSLLKSVDNHSFMKWREIVHKAYLSSSKQKKVSKKNNHLPPLHMVGGTALQPMVPLPKVKPPFLGENKTGNEYTLVLDLDETLVHYYEVNGKGKYNVRPHTQKFLKEMSEYYELVVFTAAMQDYADWVINEIDKHKYITHRLYRQHASPHGIVFVKDLSKLGRDLSKIIIVDNVAENFQMQPDNGIFIKSWFSDQKDTALSELAPLLKEIVVKKWDDVRDALRKFRDQMIEQISRGITNPKLSLD